MTVGTSFVEMVERKVINIVHDNIGKVRLLTTLALERGE
jgi:hypothetical protein